MLHIRLVHLIACISVVSALLSINIARVSSHELDWSYIPSVGLLVSLSVQKVYCGKMADWIRMPFGVVSGVGRGMGVLDGVVIVKGEEVSFGGKYGASNCNQWGFVA